MPCDSKELLRARYAPIRERKDLEDGVLFEEIIGDIYRAILKPGLAAIDGGACYGAHTFPMAKCLCGSGKVYAFEPVPASAETLRGYMAGHPLAPVIELHELALADEAGPSPFVLVPADPAWSGLKERYYPDGYKLETIHVTRTRLDDVVPSSPRVAFIKLDLEGGEYHALRGGVETLKTHRPAVVFEFGRQGMAHKYGYSAAEFFDLLRVIDYVTFDLFGHPFDESMWNDVELWMPWYFLGVPSEDDSALKLLHRSLAERVPELSV